MRTLAIPKTAEPWSLTSLREQLIKIGAKGRQPRALCDLPDGRGRGVATDVRRHPVADRSAAGTACAGMTSASQVHRERYALVQAKRRVSASGRRQPPASMALCSWRRRFAVAQAGQKRDPGLETAGNLANVGLHKARIAAAWRKLCSRLRELIFGHVPDQTVMLRLRCAAARYGARPRQRRE